jgi:hypothetical protein
MQCGEMYLSMDGQKKSRIVEKYTDGPWEGVETKVYGNIDSGCEDNIVMDCNPRDFGQATVPS